MEAKDTVMSPQQLSIKKMQAGSGQVYSTMTDHLLKEQAEISFKAGYEHARWEVGEELWCLIGNKMLEDMEAGKLLGSQLVEYMKNFLKENGL